MNNSENNLDTKHDIIMRLNKIEGQIKGIKNMIEAEKPCGDILTQVSAVRAATNKVGVLMLENYSKNCLLNSINSASSNEDEILDEFLTTIKKFIKFVE